VPFAASVGLGLALRFLVPIPAGITLQAWSLLSIFVSAIAGAARLPLPRVRLCQPAMVSLVPSQRNIQPLSSLAARWR